MLCHGRSVKVRQSASCLVFFHSSVGSSSRFSYIEVATQALDLITTPFRFPNGVGSYTLVRRRPSERPDLKAVLILYRLSTRLISSLRPLEYGMMAVAIGLSSSSSIAFSGSSAVRGLLDVPGSMGIRSPSEPS